MVLRLGAGPRLAMLALLLAACGASPDRGTPTPPPHTPDPTPTAPPTATPTPHPTATRSELPGTAWRATSLYGTPTPRRDPITLEFGETSLRGHSGCNKYGGPYMASAGTFAIQSPEGLRGVFSTGIGCPSPELRDREEAYQTALSRATRYRVRGETLELSDASGRTILTFCRVPRKRT